MFIFTAVFNGYVSIYYHATHWTGMHRSINTAVIKVWTSIILYHYLLIFYILYLPFLCVCSLIYFTASPTTQTLFASGIRTSDNLNIALFVFFDYRNIFIYLPSPMLSKNPSNLLLLVGCCNFITAFASICLTLSRVTINLLPTSSSVYV